MAEPFATVLSLYQQGKCLAAWEAGKVEGPLESWPGTEPRLLAGRLAHRLGAPRLGALLHLRAYRADPAHPEAQYYYVWQVLQRSGPLAAWRERRRLGVPRTGDGQHQADYHGQCGQLLSTLRDFEEARACLERAEAATGGRPYTHVEWCQLYGLQDRYQDALEAAQHGLAESSGYPPLVLSVAQCLLTLNRDQQALELLRFHAATGEESDIVSFLFGLLLKLRLLDEAEGAVARFDALTPLKEAATRGALAHMRADMAIQRGDYRSAVTHIGEVDHPYYRGIGENLRAFLRDAGDRAPRRVELPVAYVRQHHRTCAPATLSAISAFWSRPAEHLAVAEEICYDGTPAHSERRWAEENGWRTREFRVDWTSATALLDRGVPFTLTIADATTGHLQAAIGYDEATGVLLARDPQVPGTSEILAAELMRRQRFAGPRGMAMVPREQAHLLDGLELPEAPLYDLYHELQLALDAHDRDLAVRCHERMLAADAGHRLTLMARWALARYDSNPHESLAAVDALLGLFPDDSALLLARLQGLRQLAQREERLGWLRRACGRPDADPMLRIEYAVELGADDRRIHEAAWHLRRAMRRRPMEPYAVLQLADLTWRMGPRREALELYRFAACLDDVKEVYAQRYFSACRWERQTGAALALLEARVERLGARSGLPAMTLFRGLEILDRVDDAFAVLERALERRPDDGDLRLFAAAQYAQLGRLDQARAHREAAAGRVKRTDWLGDAARDAHLRGDREQALAHWREIVASQPLDLRAHAMIARLLSETSTRFEAVEHLQSVCESFPHHAGLRRLLYEWTAGDSAVERERVLRSVVQIDPADAWTKRELALNLHHQARTDEALAMAEEAVALDADDASGHAVAGYLLQSLNRPAEAAERFRQAIRCSADHTSAIRGLLDVSGDSTERRQEVLGFVESQLLEQAVSGDGYLAYREAARGVLTPDELLEALRRAHQARPDAWQTWSALGRHLSEMGRANEALEVARQATERFTWVPHLWLDLSQVHQARLDRDQQVEALERCRELNPDWTEATLELCSAWERSGRQEDCIRLLEGSIRRTPLVPELRARLAGLLHARGELDRALDTLRDVLRLNPDFSWAWHALTEWSAARAEVRSALDLARAFAASRPGESHPWMQVAELNLAADRPEAALDAVERALAINPRLEDAYDQKARALVMLRRFAEAELACRPPAFGERPPVPLQGRAAWLDAQRGDLAAAVRRMQAVVDAQPDYRWGWWQLVEWQAEQGELVGATRAAERLAWLEPTNVVPLGWLGELKERARDRAAAKAVYERALRLQPSYLFAGFRYVAIQRDEKNYRGARRTLEILRPHAPRERLLLAEVELEAAQSHPEQTLALVRELCGAKSFDGEALALAEQAIVQRGWGPSLERLLRDVLATSEWHPITPALWARVRISRGKLGGVFSYRWLARLGAPGAGAIYEFLGSVGERARRAQGDTLLRGYLDWHLFWMRLWCRAWRAEDDTFWGQVGYALLCAGRQREAIRWLRDWRTRRRPPPWTYQNLAVALLSRRRDREARALLSHVATEVVPRDEVSPLLRIWCSVAACLENDLATAVRLLHETPKDVVQREAQTLREFAQTLVAVLQQPAGRGSLTQARRDVIARAKVDPMGHASARLVQLGILGIARYAGDPWMTARAWLELHRRRLATAAVLLVVGLLLLA